MDYTLAEEMARKLTRAGGVLDYGPERSRLLVEVLRTLAQGRPVSGDEVDAIADGVGRPRARSTHESKEARDMGTSQVTVYYSTG